MRAAPGPAKDTPGIAVADVGQEITQRRREQPTARYVAHLPARSRQDAGGIDFAPEELQHLGDIGRRVLQRVVGESVMAGIRRVGFRFRQRGEERFGVAPDRREQRLSLLGSGSNWRATRSSFLMVSSIPHFASTRHDFLPGHKSGTI